MVEVPPVVRGETVLGGVLAGAQFTVIPLLVPGCAPAEPTWPTCDGAGVAVVGDCPLGVAVVFVEVVAPPCGTVPVGHGAAVLPNPPAVAEFEPPTVVPVVVPVLFAPGEVPGIAVVFMPGVCPGVVPDAVPGVTLGVAAPGTATPPVGGVVVVVPVVVWVPAVAGGMPGEVEVWPAVAGAVGDVVVLMPGDAVVWPAVAVPALVPAVPAVPTVCAYTHVPASRSVRSNNLRMLSSSAVETDGC